MLVLTRHAHESIVLELPDGRHITVMVTRIESRGQVRLAIDAPDDVSIVRSELLTDAAGEPLPPRKMGV